MPLKKKEYLTAVNPVPTTAPVSVPVARLLKLALKIRTEKGLFLLVDIQNGLLS
jgi:hypothetical protein